MKGELAQGRSRPVVARQRFFLLLRRCLSLSPLSPDAEAWITSAGVCGAVIQRITGWRSQPDTGKFRDMQGISRHESFGSRHRAV